MLVVSHPLKLWLNQKLLKIKIFSVILKKIFHKTKVSLQSVSNLTLISKSSQSSYLNILNNQLEPQQFNNKSLNKNHHKTKELQKT